MLHLSERRSILIRPSGKLRSRPRAEQSATGETEVPRHRRAAGTLACLPAAGPARAAPERPRGNLDAGLGEGQDGESDRARRIVTARIAHSEEGRALVARDSYLVRAHHAHVDHRARRATGRTHLDRPGQVNGVERRR